MSPFTGKDWRNATTHEGGGDETTPISAAALEDLETRVTDYTDLKTAISVKEPPYNAAGDGVTDDTAEIQAAIDACEAAGGGVVWIPESTFVVDSLTASTDVWVKGGGTSSILKVKAAATTNAAITLTGDRARISDLKVDGNRANVTNTGVGAVDAVGADRAVIERVTVVDSNGYGIRAADCTEWAIRDSIVVDSDLAGIYGVLTTSAIAGAGDMEISGCFVDRRGIGSGVADHGIAIHIDPTVTEVGRRARIVNNSVRMPTDASGAFGIEVWNGLDYSTITANTVEGGDYGISLGATDFCTVSSNIVRDCNTLLIEAAGSRYATIIGNTLNGEGNSTYGCQWNDGGGLYTNNGSFLGNTITGCTGPLHVLDTDGVAVTGNYIYQTATGADGITVQGSTYVAISGNVIETDGDGQYAVAYLGACSPVMVTGNTVKGDWDRLAGFYNDSALAFDGVVSGNAHNIYVPLGLSTGATFGDLRMEGNQSSTQFAYTVSAAGTITLPPGELVEVSGSSNISTITAAPGRRATLMFAAGGTVVDGSTLNLAGNFVYTANDTLTLVGYESGWREVSRSIN